MHLILTGATGTLGSRVLFELLEQKQIRTISLLVRDKKGKSAYARVKKIIESNPVYQSDPKKSIHLLDRITVYNLNQFLNPKTFINTDESTYLIHSAGYVNLSLDEAHKTAIYEENYEFTKTIFDNFSPFITKFIYISTAFSIGNIGGLIQNDYHNGTIPEFRNNYEASKHASEKFIIENARKNNISYQILRPSVLGGNIFDQPKYFISKYMVYYLVGKFFYKSTALKDSVRIVTNFESGLNIVPVDYVAKVIAKVYQKNIDQLNIVHSKSTSLINGMKRILDTVDFKKLSLINSDQKHFILKNKNALEQLYYNTIGMHLEPYLTSKPSEFNTDLLESILPMPEYNLEDYLEYTIAYAKSRGFVNEKW